MATHDADVVVNVTGNAQPVRRANFGIPLFATDQVDVGFTELYRIYNSNNEAQTDSDLLADAKSAAATFFSQSPRPRSLVIAKVAMTQVDTDLTALRAVYDAWYGFTVDDRTDSVIADAATWAAANDKLYIAQSSAAAILAGTPANAFETQQTAANPYGAGLWYQTDTVYADLAWLAAGLSIDMDSQSGIWAHRTLVGPAVSDGDVTSTEKANVEGDGGNLYLSFRGVGATAPGKLFDGRWIDEQVIRDWVIARVGEAIAQLMLNLANSNQKIPYDNYGLRLIGAEVEAVLQRGVSIGHFREGSVIVDVPDIYADPAEVDPADIVAREATITAEATLTGAIQTVTITIGVLSA